MKYLLVRESNGKRKILSRHSTFESAWNKGKLIDDNNANIGVQSLFDYKKTKSFWK